MRFFHALLFLATLPAVAVGHGLPRTSAATTPTHVAGHAPTGFEENKGQVRTTTGDAASFVRYRLTQGNTQLFLLDAGIAYQFSRSRDPAGVAARADDAGHDSKQRDVTRDLVRLETYRMDMHLEGADPAARVTTEGRSADYTQYYNHEALDVHTYTKVIYHEVYPGIDWVVYTTDEGFKYDFIVHPGADPNVIRLRFSHHEELSVDAEGNLIHSNRMGRFTEARPVSFQDGKEITSRFVLEGDLLRFKVGHYDRTRTLTIDPARVWGTYYGGSGEDLGWTCATDASGNMYVSGFSNSTDAIAQAGHQTTNAGDADAFLVKFDADGTRQWGTYYGGTGTDLAHHCAVDNVGNVYLAGTTGSLSGIASNGHQNTFGTGSTDAFLVKFNASGTRLWGTYYGGGANENSFYCATDGSGNVYLCGETTSATQIASNGHQNTFGNVSDAYLVKFNSNGTRLWGTYYGGTGGESGEACIVDGSGNVYLAGFTTSTNAMASGGYQDTHGGSTDAFLVKFNASGTRQWGTYYGSTGADNGWSCAVDASGNVYLAGNTASATGIASGGHQNTYGGAPSDAFLVKFNTAGTRQWATYYGGDGDERAYSCAVDNDGAVFIGGHTSSQSGIAADGDQNTYGGGESDAYLAKFDPAGVRIWASYYGGSGHDGGNHTGLYGYSGVRCAVDGDGHAFLTGSTTSASGIASGGHQNTYGGSRDGFLVKFACDDGDQDGDGIADCEDDCPNIPGEIGSPCDDDQSNTINDVIGVNCVCAGTPTAITLISSFNPSNAGGFCGIAYDADSTRIWAYDCSAAIVQQYTTAGASVRSIPRAGESSNDADLSMAPAQIMLGGTTVPYGRLLFFNGEIGTADIYGIEQGPGTIIDTLVTEFGLDHVVGGAYHPFRNTYFLVQDDDANAVNENRVAEIDPATGAVLNTWQFTGTFAVNYGDLEISAATGNIFLVSNSQNNVAEFTPEGTLVQLHPLPTGVTSLSGLSLDCATGTAWACNSSGVIYNLGGFPCQVIDVCPGGPEPGTPCDDGNAATVDDVVTAECICQGNITTGLAAPEAAHTDLRLWPNPATDALWLEVTDARSAAVTVMVRDLTGRLVIVHGSLQANAQGQLLVDLSTLTPGTYMIEVQANGQRWSRRIVKA